MKTALLLQKKEAVAIYSIISRFCNSPILGIFAFVLAGVAIAMFALKGIVLTNASGEEQWSYTLFQYTFGYKNGDTEVLKMNGGLLAAFILIIVGALGALFGSFLGYKKQKVGALCACVGSLCLIAGGILVFCIGPLTGTEIGEISGTLLGTKVVAGYIRLGIGAWLSGVLSILGGVAAMPVALLSMK